MSFKVQKPFIFIKSHHSFVRHCHSWLPVLFVSHLGNYCCPEATGTRRTQPPLTFPCPGPCFFMWVQVTIQYPSLSTQGTLQYLPWASAREKIACQGHALSWEPCGGVPLAPRWGRQCCRVQSTGPTPPSLPACLALAAEDITRGVSPLSSSFQVLSSALAFLTVRF